MGLRERPVPAAASNHSGLLHNAKPAGGELLDWQKESNTQVNKVRWIIEQVISHFKNWRIMNTDYRRPIDTFARTISAVIGLHFYRMA